MPLGLVLVDWRGQLALCGVNSDGSFAIWNPQASAPSANVLV